MSYFGNVKMGKKVDKQSELLELRRQLDNIDTGIVELFAERFGVTRSIGLLKLEQKMNDRDNLREEEILDRLRNLAEIRGCPVSFVEKVYSELFEYVGIEHRSHKKLKELES